VSFISSIFIAGVLAGAYYAGSIAIMAIAARLAADIIGYAFSVIALRFVNRGSADPYSFGWERAEIIGTLISIVTI